MREHVVGLQYPEDRFANRLTQFGPRSMTGSTFDLAAYSPGLVSLIYLSPDSSYSLQILTIVFRLHVS